MGISTEVFTVYGWKVEVSGRVKGYLVDIDYDYPEGVITDYDCEDLWMGAVMFKSGDARWSEMYGESSFTESEADDKLTKWMLNSGGFYVQLQVLCPELRWKPKFHSFVNFS